MGTHNLGHKLFINFKITNFNKVNMFLEDINMLFLKFNIFLLDSFYNFTNLIHLIIFLMDM